MAFDGANALEPLAYTGMSQYGIPDGSIAEPSNEAFVGFLTAIQGLADDTEGSSGVDLLARAHQAASDLCSGTPTAEQFAALPPRLFREFIKWLASEFTDPKE